MNNCQRFFNDFLKFQIKQAVNECFKNLKLGTNFKDYRKIRCDPKLVKQVLAFVKNS
jgi:hypothetical protein